LKIDNDNNDMTTMIDGKLDFNILTSMHIGALRNIDRGNFDEYSASDRMMNTVYELEGFGLVDKLFNLTPTGGIALDISFKVGGASEKRRAAEMSNVILELDFDYNNINRDDDDDDDGDDGAMPDYRLGGYR
jgi:hypothetical protein